MIKPGDRCDAINLWSGREGSHQFLFSHREIKEPGHYSRRLYYCIWCLQLAEGEGS